MANTGFKGVSVRQTGNQLVFRASLKDSSGVKLTTGTTVLTLYEIQSDGTLKSYDFNDNTFKTTALTTATLAMTHRTGNNSTVNTGVWTAALSTLTGFTIGGMYLAQVNNAGASPVDQEREFQYGGVEGDLLVTAGLVAGQAYIQSLGDSLLVSGSVFDGGPSSSKFGVTGITSGNIGFIGMVLQFTSGVLKGKTNIVTGWDGGSPNRMTFYKAWDQTPSTGDTFVLLGIAK